jgi:hypothetical protein
MPKEQPGNAAAPFSLPPPYRIAIRASLVTSIDLIANNSATTHHSSDAESVQNI